MKSLEEASTALFQLFDNNLLKNNLSECHLLISSNENITVKICEYEIENSVGEITWSQIRLETEYWWLHFWCM